MKVGNNMFAMLFINYCTLFALMAILGVAAYYSFTERKIPGQHAVIIVSLYAVYIMTSPNHLIWTESLVVSALVFLLGALLFVSRVMAPSEVRLMAATSLWAGAPMVLEFLVIVAMVGMALAIFKTAPMRQGLTFALQSAGGSRSISTSLNASLPLGAAIACGGVFVAARILYT